MPLRIEREAAAAIVRQAAADARNGLVDSNWVAKVEKLSKLCEEGVSKTHIAFLGTALIAKAVVADADLFAIKPDHARDNPRSYSARTLCHGVLVPLAAELGISIGVTGREPLNNQPYFRMTRLDDGTPVHTGGRAAFDFMVGCVRELAGVSSKTTARAALAAYIAVRMRFQVRYSGYDGSTSIGSKSLLDAIQIFVGEASESGRRAQAVVAGLMDVVAGHERVESGRINDPSRRYPGDVCVRSATTPGEWEKALEVRDKPVSVSDIQIFGKKCLDMNVRDAAIVMASERQEQVDEDAVSEWASRFGLGLTLFHGWGMFVNQALFWSIAPKPIAAARAAERIHQRLVAVEAPPQSVARWHALILESSRRI